MEDNFFEMPILEQMYHFRKDDFEQAIYDNKKVIREIEGKVCDNSETLVQFFNGLIQDKKSQEIFKELLQDYILSYSNEIDFWCLEYYKLGMNDMHKLKYELNPNNNKTITKGKTFFDYMDGELADYLQNKIDYNIPAYKEYKAKNREIYRKYPKVIEVFEDSMPVILNQEEMNALIELKELDAQVRAEEIKVFFKAGINEILNF